MQLIEYPPIYGVEQGYNWNHVHPPLSRLEPKICGQRVKRNIYLISYTPKTNIVVNKHYIMRLGFLKIAEIINLLATFITMHSILDDFNYLLLNYLLTIIIMALIFCLIWFLGNVFLQQLASSTRSVLVVSLLHLLFAVSILAPNCIIVDKFKYTADFPHTLQTGVVFGFISSVIFFVDAQMHFVCRRGVEMGDNQDTQTPIVLV